MFPTTQYVQLQWYENPPGSGTYELQWRVQFAAQGDWEKWQTVPYVDNPPTTVTE